MLLGQVLDQPAHTGDERIGVGGGEVDQAGGGDGFQWHAGAHCKGDLGERGDGVGGEHLVRGGHRCTVSVPTGFGVVRRQLQVRNQPLVSQDGSPLSETGSGEPVLLWRGQAQVQADVLIEIGSCHLAVPPEPPLRRIVPAVEQPGQMFSQNLDLPIRVTENPRTQPRRPARQVAGAALDRMSDRNGLQRQVGISGVVPTQRDKQLVGATDPRQVGVGGSFPQLDRGCASQAGTQHAPVPRVIEVQRETQLALVHHDGRRNAPPPAPRIERAVPLGRRDGGRGQFSRGQQPPSRCQHRLAVDQTRQIGQSGRGSPIEGAVDGAASNANLGEEPCEWRSLETGFQRVQDLG
jgi:hypothetical protein